MSPEEARLARQDGVVTTAAELIKDVKKKWSIALSEGWDHLWVPGLDSQCEEVQQIVAKHFRDLGYGFEMRFYYGAWDFEYRDYRLQITPYEPEEPGFFSRLFSRIFGGQHVSQ